VAETRTILGVGILGLAAYLYWKRQGEIDTANAQAQAQAGPAGATGIAGAGQCTSGLADEMAAAVRALPAGSNSAAKTEAIIKAAGASATAIASAINPIAGAVVGAVSTIAAVVFPMFQGKPLDPVRNVLIQEQPYAYQDQNNFIGGQPVYALDRCGYLHQLLSEINTAGYSYRDVIAVNWEIFSMMPTIGTPITNRNDMINAKIDMPRPADADTLRAVLGNDIQFCLGADPTVHGPWEANANVQPLPGSPAEWVKFAGTYEPTHTDVPAGSWG